MKYPNYKKWLKKERKDNFYLLAEAIALLNISNLEKLSFERVCEAEKKYGNSSFKKSIKELKREFEEEVADSLFYLYLICTKKNN